MFTASEIVSRGPPAVPDPTPTHKMRTNVLQMPQITKELASLQSHLDHTKARAQAEEKVLIQAVNNEINEMEHTAEEEKLFMEGVELEKAEEEQEILLHGAKDELERLEHGAKDVSTVQAQARPESPRDTLVMTNDEKSVPGSWQTKTSELYRTSGHLPNRFEKPALWRYDIEQRHPLYTTTSSDYGKFHPTVHEMPTSFHGQTSKFTKTLDQAGPYRNHSLNTK